MDLSYLKNGVTGNGFSRRCSANPVCFAMTSNELLTWNLPAPVPAREQPWELGPITDQMVPNPNTDCDEEMTPGAIPGANLHQHRHSPSPTDLHHFRQGCSGEAQGGGEGRGSTQHSCPKVWAGGKKAGEQQWEGWDGQSRRKMHFL